MEIKQFIDHLGNEISIHFPPQKIVSLVPSQTELLFQLGLDEQVIGITKFCIHPEKWFRNKQRIGGTKNINIELVKQLQPDLIIANKEENSKSQIEELSAIFPVWVSDIQTVDEAIKMIKGIGSLTGRISESENIAGEIQILLRNFKKAACKNVVYVIWKNPWMCAGGDTFINDIIAKIGWQNVFKDSNRYPEFQLEDLTSKTIDLILLSSEPFPFDSRHIDEIKLKLPATNVILVDGEFFSWYGSRLLHAIPYLQNLVNNNN